MRRMIFISILSTIFTIGRAQEKHFQPPVRLVFTADYQNSPFGYDPLWRNWPEGSLSRAMTYIRSHRRAVGDYQFALVGCGNRLAGIYALFPEDFSEKITDYCDYETSLYFTRGGWDFAIMEPESQFDYDPHVRIGLFPEDGTDRETVARRRDIDLAVMATGREPEVFKVINIEGDTVTVINLGRSGKFIGVADFRSPDEFSVKTVDISGFPVDAEYEAHFRSLSDSIRTYFDEPVCRVGLPISQSGFLLGPTPYTGLFHRFQLEATGADISFFASPRNGDDIPAGELTFGDIVRRFRYNNCLDVIELTGGEVLQYLEYTYGLRYNTMRRPTDDLVRMTRDRDGVLRTRTSVYNLDEAAGICYEVDVSRPQGRRIRIISMADGRPFEVSARYRVAINSHRLESGYLARACGLSPEEILERLRWESERDIRLMMRDWFLEQGEIVPEGEDNWKVVPESFVEAAKKNVDR